MIATTVALLMPCTAHAAACDVLKSNTYAGVLQGKFDTYPNAFEGVSLTFDAHPSGSGRAVIGYDPASATAAQSTFSGVTCASNPDGTSGVLDFGASLGANSFTVFDGGSRIWTRHQIPGRPMSGWLFRLPPAPRLP